MPPADPTTTQPLTDVVDLVARLWPDPPAWSALGAAGVAIGCVYLWFARRLDDPRRTADQIHAVIDELVPALARALVEIQRAAGRGRQPPPDPPAPRAPRPLTRRRRRRRRR